MMSDTINEQDIITEKIYEAGIMEMTDMMKIHIFFQ